MNLSPRILLAASLLFACSSGEGDDDDDDAPDDGSTDCSSLVVGDLVITEVMANPAGEDRGSEYFEIYNATSGSVDLDSLALVYSLADGSNEETHDVDDLVIEAGAYLALGTATPDDLPDFIDYGFGNDLGTLRNAGAALALRCGDTEVDRTVYPTAEGEDGVAWVLDGAAAPNHLANDDVANYCLAWPRPSSRPACSDRRAPPTSRATRSSPGPVWTGTRSARWSSLPSATSSSASSWPRRPDPTTPTSGSRSTWRATST
jgi:hypothetical protein